MKQYTVQWANNIIIGHGNIGAGVDWQKMCIRDRDYIDERLPIAGKEMIYRQVENSFTQPNAAMNIQMLERCV